MRLVRTMECIGGVHPLQVVAVKSGFANPTQVSLFLSASTIGSASDGGLSPGVRMPRNSSRSPPQGHDVRAKSKSF